MSKFIIKHNGRTVIKTTDATKAASYSSKSGYRVITIPVTR